MAAGDAYTASETSKEPPDTYHGKGHQRPGTKIACSCSPQDNVIENTTRISTTPHPLEAAAEQL